MSLFRRDKKEEFAQAHPPPEQPSSSHKPEGGVELTFEKSDALQQMEGKDLRPAKALPRVDDTSGKHGEAPASAPKSPIARDIEHILEAELGDIYLQLDPSVRSAFKQRGEETASAIERLVVSTKITVQKIFQLIASWLRIIPHVNRFYLEQEAKIKADRIMREIVDREIKAVE